jgi:hypothetical protein
LVQTARVFSPAGLENSLKKTSRKERNPAIGENLPLGVRSVVQFRRLPVMRARVNGGKGYFYLLSGPHGELE